ncbi:MAG: DegV family protein [Christensenellales bacterium]
MDNFILSTDSGCDEFKTELKRMNIFYIPLVYIEGETTHIDDFSTFEDYNFFYDELKLGKQFKTSGLNPYDLEQYFLSLLEQGKDIIHISLSSGLSGTCGTARHVAQELNATHKNKIYIIDSKSATGGQNLVLWCARKLRDEGADAKTAVAELENVVRRVSVGFYVGNLDTLRRGGRISPLAAAVGKMLQLRPILEFDKDGKLQVIDKIIGTEKAIMKLADRLVPNGIVPNTPIYITCTANFDQVNELKALIEQKIDNPTIIVNFIGPVIGSHTGPDLLSIIFQENI